METFKRLLVMSNRNRDGVVHQALQAGLIPVLLDLLDWRKEQQPQLTAAGNSEAGGESGEVGSRGGSSIDSSGSAMLRALVVDVLTAMATDGLYGEQVNEILNFSEVWAAYKNRRHDLFLPSGADREGSVVELLTATDTSRLALPGTGADARLLMAGDAAGSSPTDAPPSILPVLGADFKSNSRVLALVARPSLHATQFLKISVGL
eukprot:gene21940-28986_t